MSRLITEYKAFRACSLTCPHDEADRAVNSCSSEITNEITKNARHRLAFFSLPNFPGTVWKIFFYKQNASECAYAARRGPGEMLFQL